jgi:hypothetical protein
LVIYKILIMQDSRNASTGENNKAQQSGQDRASKEENSSFEPIKIDQQEGNMNHGTVGGHMGEDVPTRSNDSTDSNQINDHFSPPY